MGQYYTPIIKRENGKWEGFLCYDYSNGAKLMEHSYVGNQFTETVVKQLLKRPGHLAWVGDYAEDGDVKSDLANEFIEKEKEFNNKDSYNKPKTVSLMENSARLFLVNHTKKEYVNMRNYFRNAYCDEWGCIIHPLPLLTAIGNGKGGGDYRGTCLDLIGHWACDLIEVGYLDKDDKKEYVDITDKVLFKE